MSVIKIQIVLCDFKNQKKILLQKKNVLLCRIHIIVV